VASNLSELYLTSGEAEKVVEYGHRCVEYADKSGDKFWKMGARTTLADALYQAGETGEAKGLFEEAEQMQKEDQPEYPYLYSLQGYKYCDLLISIGEYEEVERRARQTLEWAQQVGAQLLTFALDKLSLGRAGLEEVKSKSVKGKSTERNLIEAKRWLDEAVDGLRKAGEQRYLPCGLLARAGYYRCQQDWDRAWGDLEEAREIAERGEMRLHLADYHLEAARLCMDEGAGSPTEEPREQPSRTPANDVRVDAKGHYEEARRLVEECGYHRRDGELKELEGRM
jgi:tetratricopeptide (TPR) repeat protein